MNLKGASELKGESKSERIWFGKAEASSHKGNHRILLVHFHASLEVEIHFFHFIF
jgi:hypothetical protein